MCLTIFTEQQGLRYPIMYVAEEDIVCYKILRVESNGKMYAPYRWDYEYVKGELASSTILQPTELQKDFIIDYDSPTREYYHVHQVNEGLHSFVNDGIAFNIAEALGAMYSYEMEREGFRFSTFKAIIPKGSFYYIGSFDAAKDQQVYASDNLVIV